MMGNVNIDEILRENVRRNHSRVVDYDPIRGVDCLGVRREVDSPDSHLPELVPEAMLDDRCYIAASGDAVGWVKLRSLYDFEYWASRLRTSSRDAMCHSCLIVRSVACLGCSKSSALPVDR